jgi:hypothetical protein
MSARKWVPLLLVAAVGAVTVRYGWKHGWFKGAPDDTAAANWVSTRPTGGKLDGAIPPDPKYRDKLNGYQQWRMAEMNKAIEASMTPFLGNKHVEVNRLRSEKESDASDLQDALNARLKYADSLLAYGDVEKALAHADETLAMARARGTKEQVADVLYRRGIAHMRQAERSNCVAHHNPESCTFPIRPAAVHADKGGAQGAMEDFQAYLEIRPGDYGVIWLLNVAGMVLGTYPEGVPEKFRIAPESVAAEGDIGRFRDLAGSLGLNRRNRAGGAVMDDFDGDGNLDLLVSSMDSATPLALYHNDGDGTFTDVAAKVGIDGHFGGLQVVQADVNNDGRLDFMVLRGAWMSMYGVMPDTLMVQQADGTFRDVSEAAGIELCAPTNSAAFADIDLDGDLDVYVSYERDETNRYTDAFDCHLFRNKGDGTFEDITGSAGVVNHGFAKGASFGDYDGDRYPDLYVSNFQQGNRLYHNNHDGTFTDVAEKLAVDKPGKGFATWFFDYDSDGWLDLFATYYDLTDAKMEVGAWYKDHKIPPRTCRLYHNDGHGGFTDATVDAHMNRVFFPMGSSFGDLDNDGYQDIYLATGDPQYSSLWPNIMLHNVGGKRFEDVTASSGTGNLQKGHGVAIGDLDNDGDEDLFVQTGGALRDDAFWNAFYENPGNANHWLTVRLVGHRSNRCAIGTRVCAKIVEPSGPRAVYGWVGSTGSFGGNSLQQELGLGQAKKIESLEVYWPTTNVTQKFENVPLDCVIKIDEDASKFEVLRLPRIRFSSGT